jgi:hypothetical protein
MLARLAVTLAAATITVPAVASGLTATAAAVASCP